MRRMMRKAIPCSVYSRVVGYFTPVEQWNEGKREEFKERYVQSVEDVVDSSKESDNGAV